GRRDGRCARRYEGGVSLDDGGVSGSAAAAAAAASAWATSTAWASPGCGCEARSASFSTLRAASVASRLQAPHREGMAQLPRWVCSWLSGGQKIGVAHCEHGISRVFLSLRNSAQAWQSRSGG